MLKKSAHEKDKVTGKFHIKNPALLSGEEFNLLVADTMHVVNAVKKRFNGSILVLGPIPRHLLDCCDDDSHKIKDEIGVEVDMIKYTDTISSQFKRALPLPADTFYVDYQQIFSTFDSKSLEDGVHLEEGQSKKLAHALLQGYEVLLPAPADNKDPDISLASAMHEAGIIIKDCPTDADTDKDALDKSIDWDDLDYE